MREIEQHFIERARNASKPAVIGLSMSGAPRAAAAPVANSSSVSDVEVSLSTVIAVERAPHRSRQQRLQGVRADRPRR